jgi:ketosteroid isomerase-like protein
LAAGTEPVRGRAAITAAIAGYWDSGFVPLSITTLGAEADGNLGYAIETVEGSTGAGIALLVLKRDARGVWKVCAEAFIGG